MFKAVIYFISIFLITFTYWTQQNFGLITLDQVILTVQFGIDGMINADPIFMHRFILWCLLLPTLIICVLLIIDKKYDLTKRSKLPGLLFILSVLLVLHQVSILDFVRRYLNFKRDYFRSLYVDSNRLQFHSQKPKSLILIYVESLESTYSDKNIFGEDLLQELNKHKSEGLSFSHYEQVPGTAWTIAAFVATQCSVPLQLVTVFGNNVQGESLTNFLSGAKCLGDILAEQGYKNIYMNGSDLKISGVLGFYKTHHYHELYGKQNWLEKGYKESDMSKWGLYDDQLWQEVKLKLVDLMQHQQLFNLTLTTMDTHGPNGYLSKTCKEKGFHDFTGIVKCSAIQVSEFIEFVRQHGWLDKVNIVILGDHLAMYNPVEAELKSSHQRYLFNLILTQQKYHQYTDAIVHFDLLPTIIESLGISYSGGRLGLGYSAISVFNPTKSPDRISIMHTRLDRYSATYNKLWAVK